MYHVKNKLSDINGSKRPGIVHRLDKNTSGVMVIAKNNFTHMNLADQFKLHTISRKYQAITWGVPSNQIVEGYIVRHKINSKKMSLNKLAFIGGSGIYNLDILNEVVAHDIVSSFGQPSSNHMRNVGNVKALAYVETHDPISNIKDSLLWRLESKNAMPKIIATNSDVEYWWSGASLAHTDATGSFDVNPPENVRVYLFSGTKHGAGSLPLTKTPAPEALRQKHFSNTIDYRPCLLYTSDAADE